MNAAAGRATKADLWLPLLQAALADRGVFRLPLRGNSMRPTLPTTCEIDIVPLIGEPMVGALLVFVADDALIAHRLVGRRDALLVAQGDNRRAPDRPLSREQVLGVVAAAWVGGRQVWPRPLAGARAAAWVARYHAWRAARWAYRQVRRWQPARI